MCDKGIIESWPGVAKLEYCITISPEVQERIISGINNCIGKEIAVLDCPLPNKYPQENHHTNTIMIAEKMSEIYTYKKYLPGRKEPICIIQHYDLICTFSLTQMHGCCGILVSHNTWVSNKYTRKGIANFMQEIKETIARDNDYSRIICTTTNDNLVEKHLLEKHGWKKLDEFINNRTTHVVETWVKDIKYE